MLLRIKGLLLGVWMDGIGTRLKLCRRLVLGPGCVVGHGGVFGGLALGSS